MKKGYKFSDQQKLEIGLKKLLNQLKDMDAMGMKILPDKYPRESIEILEEMLRTKNYSEFPVIQDTFKDVEKCLKENKSKRGLWYYYKLE